MKKLAVLASETSANQGYLSAHNFVNSLADSSHSPVEHQIFTDETYILMSRVEFDSRPENPKVKVAILNAFLLYM